MVGTRPEVAAEMAIIAAHEGEGRGCHAREAADLADAAAGGVEEVEVPVVEEVVGGELNQCGGLC